MLRPLALLVYLAGCVAPSAELGVDLATARLEIGEVSGWPSPAIESAHPEITVRQVFTARGPCRVLDASLMRRYPGEYLLRVAATEARCESETPYIGYTAVLQGLPPGSHRLRVVHVGADGRTLAEVVLEHPVVVTRPGQSEENR